jgi:CelD/BcsL family acetyltransferase involved in cellulose biosynthesis
MSGSTNSAWERRLVPLVYGVSYRKLGAVMLPLACRVANPSESPLGSAEPPPTPGLPLPDTYGCLNWSQPICEGFPILRWRGHTLVYAAQRYKRYFLDLNGGYETYLLKFSSKSRSTLKRKVRKFAELSGGSIDWRTYRTAEEIEEFLQLATPLSNRSYQERLFGAGLLTESGYRASVARLAQEDQVRAYLLFLNGEPVAYLFCPANDSVLVYDKQGYDPKHAAHSPGTVLQVLALEALFKEGKFQVLDFTEGEGEHKEFFSTHSQLCADVFVLDRRFSTTALVILHASLLLVVQQVRSCLHRIGILGRVRRLLRA